jgi:hypothetical protein
MRISAQYARARAREDCRQPVRSSRARQIASSRTAANFPACNPFLKERFSLIPELERFVGERPL